MAKQEAEIMVSNIECPDLVRIFKLITPLWEEMTEHLKICQQCREYFKKSIPNTKEAFLKATPEMFDKILLEDVKHG